MQTIATSLLSLAAFGPQISNQSAVGIDLGTTNSCVATVNQNGEDSLRVLVDSHGSKTIPSVLRVEFDENGEMRFDVGKTAVLKHKSETFSGRFFTSCKRLLGYSSLKDDNLKSKIKGKISFKIKKATEKGKEFIYIPIVNDKEKEVYRLTPIEVSAKILGHMKSIVERENEEIKKLYVTVPAYFSNAQKDATKAACEIAGLNISGTVAEPVAAAFTYKVKHSYGEEFNDENKNIIVVDLGGGTTDISALSSGSNGLAEVLTYSGSNFLGGDNVNHLLAAHFKEELKKDRNYTTKSNLEKSRLEIFSEEFKILVCTRQLANRNLDEVIKSTFIVPKNENTEGFEHEFSMTAKKFDEICEKFYKDFKKTLTGSDGILPKLKEQHKTVNDINVVLHVGGSTRIPKVREIIKEIFVTNPKKKDSKAKIASLNYDLDVDVCVAQGAALYAAEKAKFLSKDAQITFVDVMALSMGVATVGDVMSEIVSKDTPLPASGTRTFTTQRDGQTDIKIEVAQGPYMKFSKNKKLGTLDLKLKKKMRAHEPQIDVTLEVMDDHEIVVTALETITNTKAEVRISRSDASLSKDAIKKMTEEYNKNKEKDDIFAKTQESLNAMNATIFSTKKSIEGLTGEKKTQAEELIKTLEMWYNINRLDTTSEKVDARLKEFKKDISELVGGEVNEESDDSGIESDIESSDEKKDL